MDHRESKGIPEKHYFGFLGYIKDFDCVDHNKLWEILKEMRKPDHLTCFLRNLHAGQEAAIRNGYGTMVEKGMATHSLFPPGTREPGGLPSMGSHRVGT